MTTTFLPKLQTCWANAVARGVHESWLSAVSNHTLIYAPFAESLGTDTVCLLSGCYLRCEQECHLLALGIVML